MPEPGVIATAIPSRPANEKVLVGVLNHPRDLILARDQRWYRIPVTSARKWLTRHWPPRWIAFYQTKIFREQAFSIQQFAEILNIHTATRAQLLPAEPRHPRANEPYYQLQLGALQNLPAPILSRRWRRIVFIPTHWRKFVSAKEINDLYDESPLEDLLWDRLRSLHQNPPYLPLPERQEFVTANGHEYALDFAFYGAQGKMAVETDGDTWHADPARIPEDNRRDNDLHTNGWTTLRFNGFQLREEMASYCLPTILNGFRLLGGSATDSIVASHPAPTPTAEAIRYPVGEARRKRHGPSIEERRVDHPRAYEKWTGEEDKRLRELFVDGQRPRQISELLQRKPSAIRSRLKKLQLIEP